MPKPRARLFNKAVVDAGLGSNPIGAVTGLADVAKRRDQHARHRRFRIRRDIEPVGFQVRLECALLNSFQARWQLVADRMGSGFAQGTMPFRLRDLLERAGGVAILGREMAEDVAATNVVRAAGLPARLFARPIGPRGINAVWSRPLHWARVRRLGVPLLVLPESLAGIAVRLLGLLALVATGQQP